MGETTTSVPVAPVTAAPPASAAQVVVEPVPPPVTEVQAHEDAPITKVTPSTEQTHDKSQHTDVVALPQAEDVSPEKQAEHLADAKPKVVEKQVEKTKAAKRELEGKEPGGSLGIPGIEDDTMYYLLRRFSGQTTHVLKTSTLPVGELDLRPSTLPDVPFRSDSIQSSMERLYGSVGISLIRGARELERITSWRERNRSIAWLVAYSIAWIFHQTTPLILALLIVIVAFPQARPLLFPVVPPPPGVPVSATDPLNQKGDESLVESVGDPVVHRSKSEQVEQQSWEFMSSIQRFGVKVLVGGHANHGNGKVGEKYEEDEDDDDDDDDDEDDEDDGPNVPGLKGGSSSDEDHVLVHHALDDKKLETDDTGKLLTPDEQKKAAEEDDKKVVKVDGKKMSKKQLKKLAAKKAKEERDRTMAVYAKLLQDVLNSFANGVEMLQNSLVPPKAHHSNTARFKIAGAVLLPVLLITAIIPPWMFAQGGSLILGLAFFAQPPAIWAAKKGAPFAKELSQKEWFKEAMDLRNSLFSKVPTNAQLTLHILRVRERLGKPIPPPPSKPVAGAVAAGVSDSSPDMLTAEEETGIEGADGDGDDSASTKVKKKTKGKFVGALRGVGKKIAGFHADVTIEGARQKIGTKIDRLMLHGFLEDDGSDCSYPGKLNGKTGRIIITPITKQTPIPLLSFVPLTIGKDEETESFPISSIVEIKKNGIGIGRSVLGWVGGIDIEGAGLELRVERPGILEGTETLQINSIARREQLFNRLVALGDQKWESL